MKRTRLDGLLHWGVYQPDRALDFNGFLWVRPGGNVLFDPMPLDAAGLAELRAAGGAAWILLTNADHLRAAPELARELGAKVAAPAGDRARFGERAAAVDLWFTGARDLPAGLAGEVRVFDLAGGKSPVEVAFWLAGPKALLFGDAVRSHESGRLRLLPDPKLADRAALASSLRPLADLPVEAVLLGDGDSLFTGAREALALLLASLDRPAPSAPAPRP